MIFSATDVWNGNFVQNLDLNTLRLRQNGHHFTDDIFKCIFLNENLWISLKISLKFIPKVQINNILTLVQIMAWCHPGNKPLPEPMMVSLPMHTCITQPRWIKLHFQLLQIILQYPILSLQWRHNGHDRVSNHQPHDCLFNCLFRHRSKKTSKLRVTGLCARNSPGTGEFPAQMASNTENVSIWWRHHDGTGDNIKAD